MLFAGAEPHPCCCSCCRRFCELYPGFEKWASWKLGDGVKAPWLEEQQQQALERSRKGRRRGEQAAGRQQTGRQRSAASGLQEQQQQQQQQQQRGAAPQAAAPETSSADEQMEGQHIAVGKHRLHKPNRTRAAAAAGGSSGTPAPTTSDSGDLVALEEEEQQGSTSVGDIHIEALHKPHAAVLTSLASGAELGKAVLHAEQLLHV